MENAVQKVICKTVTVCYLGIYRPVAPRDKVYLDVLKKRGVKMLECIDSSAGLLKFFRLAEKLYALHGEYDSVWVGYLSTMVVPLARLLSRKKIIYNALDSWYDRTVNDRGRHSKFSPKAWAIWLVDFSAFHLADVVLVESESQKKYIAGQFKVEPSKLRVIFTGTDSAVFFPDPSVKKRDRFTAVYRGMFLPATGAEYVVEAAKILKNESVDFIIIGWGQELPKIRKLLADYKLPNVKLVTEFLQPKALRELLLSCHVVLGQFAAHQRMERTIQHKTFEALALGMPYITRDSASNRELLTDGVDCLFVPPADAQAIAEKVLFLKKNPSLLSALSKNALSRAILVKNGIERKINEVMKFF